ncbi:MAG TPA: ABC transporter permease [Vicinamibacterales bacterium]|jgi:predicted permease|nr:ABC transporter permease [Vicinamibacterales bacterium]
MRFERWRLVLPLRLRSLFLGRRLDRELDDELGFHVERLTDRNIDSGMTPTEARRAALAAMDGLQARKEECRDMRHIRLVEELVGDARYTWRQFRKSPGFAVVITLVLALAIGGNTAVFSVAHAAFTPLPIPEADRTVMVWTENAARNWHQFPSSMAEVRDWQASGVFSSLGAFVEVGFNLRLGDRTDRLEGLRTTPEFFEALAIQAARGRVFAAGDVDTDQTVVLSDRLWRATFDGDPAIVGQTIVLNGAPRTVIGVLPPRFPRFAHEDLYALVRASPQLTSERSSRDLSVIGRLRPGLSIAAARERMTQVSLDLAKRYPRDEAGTTASLQLVQDAYLQDAHLLLVLLLGAVACALAVACANVASLLLARGVARRRELAIRSALGGGRWRLTRQLLTEHLLLGVTAGVASLIPAWWGVRFVASFGLDELPNADLAGLNMPVLAFNFGVALLTGVLCGVLPAWLAWRHDVNATLKGSSSVGGGRTAQRLRGAFVVGQIALTVVLLVGGGLILRSFLRILTESPGYNPDHVLTLQVALSATQYTASERQAAFFERVVERARSLPGVVAVSAARELPTSDNLHGSGLLFPGQPEPRLADIPLALNNAVLADYFRVMEIPLVRGRFFSGADTKDSPPVTVVDEWTANRYWPHQNPVGQRIRLGRSQPWREIVGVVKDVEAPVLVRFLKGRVGQVYLPLAQDAFPQMSVVVRTSGDATAVAGPMRAIVREIDRDQPVFHVQTLDDVRVSGRRVVRLITTLLTGFAVMALLLATVGLYGTVAYDVGQRTREFGLRLSLGAQPAAVMAMVLRRGNRLLVVGAGVGFLGALVSTRMVASFLYGVQAGDPLTFILTVLLLGVSGLLASYVPARRATQVDPVVALRCE